MFPYRLLFLLSSPLVTSNELLSPGLAPAIDAERHRIVQTGFSPDSSRFNPICGKRGAGTCENTIGSYICKCNSGFKLTKSMCDDIDECVDPSACGQEGSGRCENEVGSFKCHCNFGFRLQNNTCQDIDECVNPSACGEEGSRRCENEFGSFKCHCNSGFRLLNNTCQDIDECINQDICGEKMAGSCQNRLGSYTCVCNKGFGIEHGKCHDINECMNKNPICGERGTGTCENTIGSYSCKCDSGFELTKSMTCEDIDECDNPSACGEEGSGRCENTVGSFKCHCNSGFRLISNKCQDIDECINQDTCGEKMAGSRCQNTIGSYICVCKPGFEKEHGKCRDINECMNKNPICGTTNFLRCENTPGSYKCHCRNAIAGVNYIPDNGVCAVVTVSGNNVTGTCEGDFKFFCDPRGHCNCYISVTTADFASKVKQICRMKGGSSPLVIRSAEEQNFITNYANDFYHISTIPFTGAVPKVYHIGAQRVSGLQFAWYDGEQMGYTNWEEGYPNHPANKTDKRDCVASFTGIGKKWFTILCTQEAYPICQKPFTIIEPQRKI